MPEKKETNVESVLSKLEFAPEDCISAAARNPLLFRDAADFRVSCLRKRNAAKMAWESGSGARELKLRKEARAGGEKITNDEVTASLLTDPTVALLRKKFDDADEMDEYSKLVVEAVRMRRDALRVIGDLVREEVSVQRAMEAGAGKIEDARRRLRERFPGAGR